MALYNFILKNWLLVVGSALWSNFKSFFFFYWIFFFKVNSQNGATFNSVFRYIRSYCACNHVVGLIPGAIPKCLWARYWTLIRSWCCVISRWARSRGEEIWVPCRWKKMRYTVYAVCSFLPPRFFNESGCFLVWSTGYQTYNHCWRSKWHFVLFVHRCHKQWLCLFGNEKKKNGDCSSYINGMLNSFFKRFLWMLLICSAAVGISTFWLQNLQTSWTVMCGSVWERESESDLLSLRLQKKLGLSDIQTGVGGRTKANTVLI